MHSLIVFASGAGSNARAIIDYFKQTGRAKVVLIVSNKQDAGVLKIAAEKGIPSIVVDKNVFADTGFAKQLESYNPSLLVLAGFLWKIPQDIVHTFNGRIVNIHPALLPKYGGKGMYGHHVHRAVIENGDEHSGITIHYVDEVYDNGAPIVQAYCPVLSSYNADELAMQIHKLEHYYYPRTIDYLLQNI